MENHEPVPGGEHENDHAPTNRDDPIIVIGGGLAGLSTALSLAPIPTIVISANDLTQQTSSRWAQGGMAAAMGADDAPEHHAGDTVAAGAGLVWPQAAKALADDAPGAIDWLRRLGVGFDRGHDGALILSREAAHRRRRVVRAGGGDTSGAAVMDALHARMEDCASALVLENARAVALEGDRRGVHGVHVAVGDRQAPKVILLRARAVVLATGGLGQLYAVTTNPQGAHGGGVALGAQVGALVRDPEFVQFHPTALDVGLDPAPLASEAIRGDGATLVNASGERFMLAADPRAELAPRDVVARAVHAEISAGHGAFLDGREAIGAAFPQAFPTVTRACHAAGIDPVSDVIPIAPGAHYHMGGLLTDLRGRTTVPGLWAVGEVASSGVHGANRLASNSLMEAVVFARRAAEDIATALPSPSHSHGARAANPVVARSAEVQPTPAADNRWLKALTPLRPWRRHAPDALATRARALSEDERLDRARLRHVMADELGVVRTRDGIERAIGTICQIHETHGPDSPLAEHLLVASLICAGALARGENVGGHFRNDARVPGPGQASPPPRHTVISLTAPGGARLEHQPVGAPDQDLFSWHLPDGPTAAPAHRGAASGSNERHRAVEHAGVSSLAV